MTFCKNFYTPNDGDLHRARIRRCSEAPTRDLLLAGAARFVLEAARSLAVFAIIVDAKNEIAAAFDRDFGFTPFPNRPQRLFMPIADASEAMSRALPE